jgi:hypothetical protein
MVSECEKSREDEGIPIDGDDFEPDESTYDV